MARHLRVHFSKDLGFLDAVGLGIGFIVGSGIYIMPILTAQAGGISLLAWVIGGIVSILTGLCFAECAIRIPKVGGLYAYAHQTLGDFWGFITGYTFWLGYVVTIAAEILAISWYISFFWEADLLYRIGIGCVLAFFFTLINYRGVNLGGKLEDFLTVGKLLPLLVFIAAAAFFFNPSKVFTAASNDSLSFIGVIILTLWAYQGVEIITVPEEEIKHAKKTVPKAIIVSVITVMALYLLVAASVLTLNWLPFASSQAPLADLAKQTIGNTGAFILAIGGLLSILGSLNAVVLGSSRISYAMAKDNLFPKYFNHLHEKHNTPDHALWTHLAIAIVMSFLIQDFSKIAVLAVIFTLFPYLFSCIATLQIQKKKTHVHSLLNNNQTIPLLATLVTLCLLGYSLYTNPYLPTLLLGVGIVGYAVAKP